MASRPSIIGALALGTQSSKGNVATGFHWIPATSINLNPNQNTQALPPEIGGSYFIRSAYKAGVSTAGDVSVVMRPDGFGQLLYAMCGTDVVTPVVAQSGAYSHAMTPFAPAASADLPWLTAIKDTAQMYQEQFLDTKLSMLRIEMAKQSVVNCSASFFGLVPSEVAVTDPTMRTFDNTPDFQTCVATVSFVNEEGDASISANANLVERISLDFQNHLSEDEFVVGSFYAVDSTLLQRTVNISIDTVIRDPALIRAVYRNGGTGAWSPTIFRGHLHVSLLSTGLVPATTQPYQLDMDFPGIDFMAMPVPLNGAQLIRANLTAQVSLGTSGADTFAFTLINGVASY